MVFLALLTLKERDTAVKKIPEDMNKIQEEWKEIADVIKQEAAIMEEKSNHRFVVDLERRMIAKVMVKTIAIVFTAHGTGGQSPSPSPPLAHG